MPFVNKIMNWKINLNKFSWQPLIASAVRCAVAWMKKLKASLLISLIENGTKDERKAEILSNPQGSYLPFSLLAFVDEWICDMHVHNIFVHPESGGAEKTKRWEEIIFNGSSPQICHTLCHCEAVCSTSPTLLRSRIYSITITSLNCVSNMSEISPFTQNRISRDRKIWKFPVHWMKKCSPCTK